MRVAQAQQVLPKRLSSVLIVDDHSTLADLLSLALSVESDFACVGTAPDIGQAVAAARHLRPDMVMMDIRLGRECGVETVVEAQRLGLLEAADARV